MQPINDQPTTFLMIKKTEDDVGFDLRLRGSARVLQLRRVQHLGRRQVHPSSPGNHLRERRRADGRRPPLPHSLPQSGRQRVHQTIH